MIEESLFGDTVKQPDEVFTGPDAPIARIWTLATRDRKASTASGTDADGTGDCFVELEGVEVAVAVWVFLTDAAELEGDLRGIS